MSAELATSKHPVHILSSCFLDVGRTSNAIHVYENCQDQSLIEKTMTEHLQSLGAADNCTYQLSQPTSSLQWERQGSTRWANFAIKEA